VDRRFKIELLTRLIDLHDLRLGIIFCNTKRMVDDLVDHLVGQGYSADRLHGDMSQMMRDRVMTRFRKSGLEFLVATDVAARGIDVDDVQVVFNYDLPYDGEDYLHRIGRTGRAGRAGLAVSFASGRELFQIQQIERFTRVRMRRGKPPTADEVEEARESQFLDKVRATLQSGKYKRQDHLIEHLLEEGFTSTDIASALIHHLKENQAPAPPAQEPKPGFEQRKPRPAKPATRVPPPGVTSPPVAPPAPKPVPAGFPERKLPPREEPARSPKHSRRTPEGQTRLYVNVGKEMGIAPADLVATISGETGLPASVVGTIDVRERHLFADVAAEHAARIVSKLNRAQVKNFRLKVKIA
jgi:ATP-dependent RNA helicase DeaD